MSLLNFDERCVHSRENKNDPHIIDTHTKSGPIIDLWQLFLKPQILFSCITRNLFTEQKFQWKTPNQYFDNELFVTSSRFIARSFDFCWKGKRIIESMRRSFTHTLCVIILLSKIKYSLEHAIVIWHASGETPLYCSMNTNSRVQISINGHRVDW